MMRGVRYVVAGLATAVLIGACSRGPDDRSQKPDDVEIPFTKHGTLELMRGGEPYLTIDIEIVDNDSSRMRGMMQRTSFPEMSGMLFIFPYEAMQSFWMANTPVALDILFADADSQIVDIHRYTRPLSPQSVDTSVPARFVLEVPAGFSDTHGIVESDRLRWRRSPP